MERLRTKQLSQSAQEMYALSCTKCAECQLEIVHTRPIAGAKAHQCNLFYPLGVKSYHGSGVLASFVHGFLSGSLLQSNHLL